MAKLPSHFYTLGAEPGVSRHTFPDREPDGPDEPEIRLNNEGHAYNIGLMLALELHGTAQTLPQLLRMLGIDPSAVLFFAI